MQRNVNVKVVFECVCACLCVCVMRGNEVNIKVERVHSLD